MPGAYDIIVDVNSDGYYYATIDALDDMAVNGAGLLVVPDYWLGTILGLAGCFAALGIFRLKRRKR